MMAQTGSKSQFKPHSLEYFRKIEQSGEELVITDLSTALSRLCPGKYGHRR